MWPPIDWNEVPSAKDQELSLLCKKTVAESWPRTDVRVNVCEIAYLSHISFAPK